MITNIIPLGNMNGAVAAGNMLTLPIPSTGVIHSIRIMCKKTASPYFMTEAEIIADIDYIQVRAKGDLKVDVTPLDLFNLWRYYNGRNTAYTMAGTIPINLIRKFVGPASKQSLLGWGTKDIENNNISLYVKVKAIATLVSVSVAIEVEQASRNLGRHLCLCPLAETWPATGQQTIKNFDVGEPDKAFLALHVGVGSGAISQVNVAATYDASQTVQIYKELEWNQQIMRLREHGRVAQTGLLHIDFTINDEESAYLPNGPLKVLTVEPTWITAAPDGYKILIEEIRGLLSPVA
jgi:hypothetical protein